MSVATFVPEIWTGKLLTAFDKKLVYAGLVNRDYEGEISQAGDTVRINSVGRVTIAPYVPNVTEVDPETLDTTDQTLVVDQCHYFAFEVDDVDKRQAKSGLVGEATKTAGHDFADIIDQYIVDQYVNVDASNDLGTIDVTDGDEAYALLVAMRTACEEANLPSDGRWAVIPPWITGHLLMNNKFVANAALAQSGGNLLNGKVGRAAGFDIYESNNNPVITGDDYLAWAGIKPAITMAQQINEVEAYRSQKRFADVVRGLLLYGAKMVRNDAVVVAAASQTESGS